MTPKFADIAGSGRVYSPDRNQISSFIGKNGFNWTEGEIIYPSAPQTGDVIRLNTPLELLNRRLYFFAELALSTPSAAYVWRAFLKCSAQGRIVSEIPVHLASDPAAAGYFGPRSLWSTVLNTPATVNPARLQVASPFTGGQTTVDLAPLELRAEFDEVKLVVDSFSVASGTFDGYRASLAVLSHL